MTERIKQLRSYFIDEKKQLSFRQVNEYSPQALERLGAMKPHRAAACMLSMVLEKEMPVILPFERIPFMRTGSNIPIHALEPLFEGHVRHEQGILNNICVDYSLLLSKGFNSAIEELYCRVSMLNNAGEIEKAEYLESALLVLNSILSLCDRYRDKAKEIGNETVYGILQRIPREKPQSFLDALVFFRILHFAMWASGSNHNTIGRFDVLMKPYFDDDVEKGVLDETSALELIEEFFLTFNRDSDLYFGVQRGDNGQSLVLGGVDRNGASVFSKLSELCLRASCELSVIDPKINLRVDKTTPDFVYELGTELTKKGLGFPQYSNDDVIIPALLRWGYDLEDARNYAVAACWEIIIPGKGADIPNIAALSFAACAERSIRLGLEEADTFEAIMQTTEREIETTCKKLVSQTNGVFVLPNPMLSLLMESLWKKISTLLKVPNTVTTEFTGRDLRQRLTH